MSKELKNDEIQRDNNVSNNDEVKKETQIIEEENKLNENILVEEDFNYTEKLESNQEYLDLLAKIKNRVENENIDLNIQEPVITELNNEEEIKLEIEEKIEENIEQEIDRVTEETVETNKEEDIYEKTVISNLEQDFDETIIIDKEEIAKALAEAGNVESSNVKEVDKNIFVAPALATKVLADQLEKQNIISNVVDEKIEEPTKDYRDIALEVLGLKKRIGFKTIVEDITFDMKKGEIIGLLGPNGSGKTTIMRMLVGLTKISQGEVYCFEKPLGLGNTKMLSEVGSMIESPEFYNYMSGYSNLKQLARLSGKKIKRAKIKELIKFVGLEKVARKKVKTYSLGMRQRLGLAQALLNDPKILILDEPVNGLDPQGVQEFRNKLKEIAETGVSILISSHLLDEIEKVSDRIIVLEKGRIIADDTLENLCSEDVERTIISTYDNDRAEILINELDIPYVREVNGFVFEDISKDEKAKIISYLVNSHVDVDTIHIARKTLEERFLEITGKGGL